MNPRVVSREEWLHSRLELLAQEKAHSRARDELTRARQAMPWVKVEKEYSFDGPQGKVTLADLFGSKSQLLLYHFMFDSEWDEGCKACSFMADHYERLIVHLAHRDVTFATVSRATRDRLESFRQRMGWTFPWFSSADSDFNRDFHVSFGEDELSGRAYYNYQEGSSFPVKEAPGLSVFARDEEGHVYHTYSCYARGLENLLGAYDFLDLVPKGRNEDGLSYGMEWLRHRDRYDHDANYRDPYADKL